MNMGVSNKIHRKSKCQVNKLSLLIFHSNFNSIFLVFVIKWQSKLQLLANLVEVVCATFSKYVHSIHIKQQSKWHLTLDWFIFRQCSKGPGRHAQTSNGKITNTATKSMFKYFNQLQVLSRSHLKKHEKIIIIIIAKKIVSRKIERSLFFSFSTYTFEWC